MPIGEFEYVKPPRFYMDKKVEEDLLPHLTERRDREKVSNPFINGPRPLTDNSEEWSDNVTEIEIVLDDTKTSTKRIVVKRTVKNRLGRTPKLDGKEDEIVAKYNEGVTLKELAAMYGVSTPCMADTVRRGGGTVRARGRKKR